QQLELPSLPRVLALRPDGGAVAFGGADGVVHVHELATAAARELHGHQRAVTALAWCGDAPRLATGGDDGSVGVWHLELGERLLIYRQHGGAVHTLVYEPAAARLLAISGALGATILESTAAAPRDR